MEEVLDSGRKQIRLFFDQVKLVQLPVAEFRNIDPQEQSFQNINTPQDYFHLRGSLNSHIETEALQHSG